MRRIIEEITDDITGEPNAIAVRFAYAGKEMEIDLTPANREQFDKAMAVYMECGRPVNGKAPAKPSRATDGSRRVSVAPAASTQSAAIRAWWKTRPESHDAPPISNVGRIPVSVRQRWIDAGSPIIDETPRPTLIDEA